MRVREAVVLSSLTACGINPAYDEASATRASTQAASSEAATTDAPPPTTSGTTTSGTTGGLEATADHGSTSTTSPTSTTASGTTTTGDASTTTTGAATTGAPAGDCPAEDDSLVACYAFEEDPRGGTMYDGSGNGYDGSRVGAGAVASVEGFGAAVDLGPGSDVHVVDHKQFAPAKLTLATFFYIDQAQVEKALIDRAGSYRLYLTEGRIQCQIQTTLATVQVEVDIDVGRWYHFACTFDGERMKLHGHGLEFDPSPVEVLLAGEINDNPAEFVLGRVNGNDATKLLGALDQVMVFSRALEAEELCELAGPLCNTP